ncbi:arylamine N-acetyltransferase family protein [Streptomyces avicenniae]|uniref:arylamine N-acetyltransferase family protein n=1 Tax=Streptomyces avicenniae TaxID=500153 RepID=UPI00069B3243|nr:arylamine N-acetyltransferase [Streptomyces avicenniae]
MTTHDPDIFDLAAYLDRIGHDGPVAADLATVQALQRAHIMAIPFENLDPVRGIVPSLELADLQDKLVRRGRGGYCYEHNRLFGAALETVGLNVRYVAGRVVLGTDRYASRAHTHLTLLVGVPGEPGTYLVEAGFGGTGMPFAPLPLTEGTEHTAHGRRHRLLRLPSVTDRPLPDGITAGHGDGEPFGWLLQAHEPGGWADQYVFTTEPSPYIDQVVGNWYVAAHARSPFSGRIVAQRTTPGLHWLLVGRELVLTRDDGTEERRTLADDDEVRKVLVTDMGIPVDDD